MWWKMSKQLEGVLGWKEMVRYSKVNEQFKQFQKNHIECKNLGQVHKLDGCIQRVVWSQMDTSTVLWVYPCADVGCNQLIWS
jgi:hypothetical protein